MEFNMEVKFGCSERGKSTVIFRGFEYWKHRANKNGTVVWYCCKHASFHCKARLTTAGDRIVGERQPEHTHEGNISTSLARKAVGEMKTLMGNLRATPTSSQGSVCATLDEHVLMALPKRSTVTRTLQRHRHVVIAAGHGNVQLPPVPSDLLFEIPAVFHDMVLYD